MTDAVTTLRQLKDRVETFKTERGWGSGHSPKNVAVSIAVEAAELLEHYQWNDTPRSMDKVATELADIVIYCLSFANATGIDIAQAVQAKMDHNAKKFPVALFNKESANEDAFYTIKEQYRQQEKE